MEMTKHRIVFQHYKNLSVLCSQDFPSFFSTFKQLSQELPLGGGDGSHPQQRSEPNFQPDNIDATGKQVVFKTWQMGGGRRREVLVGWLVGWQAAGARGRQQRGKAIRL